MHTYMHAYPQNHKVTHVCVCVCVCVCVQGKTRANIEQSTRTRVLVIC